LFFGKFGLRQLGARRGRGCSEPPRAKGSRPKPGRISFFFHLRQPQVAQHADLRQFCSSVASRVFGRLAAAASGNKIEKINRHAAAASQLKSEKRKEKKTYGRHKSKKWNFEPGGNPPTNSPSSINTTQLEPGLKSMFFH